MDDYPVTHELGRIDVVTLVDAPALSRDVALDIEAVQSAWPAFERAFDSLQGRRMLGLVYGGNAVYRLACVRLARDAENALGLDETTIPGGDYLRLRLRGEAPDVYGQISDAFDVLFARANHDAERPHIEAYRREGEVDCLVPISSQR
ncbi:GyrI-like domain-containing protein [Microbacterium sp. WCS2018Hpa-9]|uniref:GyrI-like domain-containing protein n=1 Tax=Microbacterium sp. WCS2018Hpa-9 TaxID=3073635 RepID=UPI0028891E91|nr:GyrI-like domain-containing protein [Microbacterium sp. WCS2018Hpa-9]